MTGVRPVAASGHGGISRNRSVLLYAASGIVTMAQPLIYGIVIVTDSQTTANPAHGADFD